MPFLSGAVISDCQQYRYVLWRIWNEDLPLLGFLMLNPSTADASLDDPTVTRCIHRAERMNFGGIIVINLFAYRATNPKELRQVTDPIGPENDRHILEQVERVSVLVCAWGTHGVLNERNTSVLQILRNHYPEKLHYLQLTRAGHPKHPLYVSYANKPALWTDQEPNTDGT